MASDVRTSSSVGAGSDLRKRAEYWLLLDGNRLLVAGGLVAGFFLAVRGLVWLDVVAVGSSGYAATLFGSGLTSGVVTLMMIALSINQLILSRVFGSPDELSNRLEGTRDLRGTVEDLADVHSSPNDPSEFLSLLATTLSDRAQTLQENIAAFDWEPPAEVTDGVQDVVDYGRNVDGHLDDQSDIIDVLDVVIGAEYAWNMIAVQQFQSEYADQLSVDVRAEFQAVESLLESIAVARQFFKTFALQQNFATLSRMVVYLGLAALLAAISLTLVYRSNSVAVAETTLPLVVSAGIAVIVAPLAVFVSYVLRASTIANRTVSVGPFVPPNQQ